MFAQVTPGARVPGTLGRRVGLIAALWVAASLTLAAASFWWQALQPGGLDRLEAALLLPALGFAAASFALRTLRWHFFLRAAGARPPLWASLRTQLIGFSLTMTPGKVGEVYKCYLMELETGVPTARTAPIFIFEKLMDGLAFAGLALLAAAALPGLAESVSSGARSLLVLLLLGAGLGASLRAARSEATVRFLVRALVRLPQSAQLASLVGTALRGGADLLKAQLLIQNIGLSLIARTCDGMAVAWTAWALGIELPALAGVFVLNSAGTVGGLSMLPGGIGVVEASMSLLLVSLGTAPGAALAATFVARLIVFWVWVSIGLALLFMGLARNQTPP